MAKEFLAQRGVAFVEKDVTRDPSAAQEMVRRSGQQGVPVILVDDQVVVGFNQPLLNQLLAQRRLKLGVSVADAATMREKYNLSVSQGALVGKVQPNSIGQRAGLQTGDVIVEIAGRPIRTAQDVTDTVARLGGTKEVSITWVRGGRTMKGSARA